MQIVLEGSACQKEAIAAVELAETLGDLAVFVFQFVRLVHDDVLPLEAEELVHAGAHPLERGQAHVELSRQEVVLQQFFSLNLCGDQVEDADLRTPPLELFFPV